MCCYKIEIFCYFNQVSLAEDLADFTIVCAGGGEVICQMLQSSSDTVFQIKSHKLILACQSKFFEGFFRRETKDMVMLDFKEEYVRICIAYMVTGEVNLNTEAEELEGVLEVGFDFSSNLCNLLSGGKLLGHGLLG